MITHVAVAVLKTSQKVKKSEVKIKLKKNWHIFCPYLKHEFVVNVCYSFRLYLYLLQIKTIKLYTILYISTCLSTGQYIKFNDYGKPTNNLQNYFLIGLVSCMKRKLLFIMIGQMRGSFDG